jgi:Nickel responsive protein SCO4226-like
MPRYLIERAFDLPDLPVAEIVERNADDGVTWLHSYVSRDRRTSFDVYDAPSPEAVRRASKRNSLGIESITEVRVLDPYRYEP